MQVAYLGRKNSELLLAGTGGTCPAALYLTYTVEQVNKPVVLTSPHVSDLILQMGGNGELSLTSMRGRLRGDGQQTSLTVRYSPCLT